MLNLKPNEVYQIKDADITPFTWHEARHIFNNLLLNDWVVTVHDAQGKQVKCVSSASREELEGWINAHCKDFGFKVYYHAHLNDLCDKIGIKRVALRSQKRAFVIDAGFKVLDQMARSPITARTIKMNGLSIPEFKAQMISVASSCFNKNFSGTNGHFDTNSVDELYNFLTWVNVGGFYNDQTVHSRIQLGLYIRRDQYFELCEMYGVNP